MGKRVLSIAILALILLSGCEKKTEDNIAIGVFDISSTGISNPDCEYLLPFSSDLGEVLITQANFDTPSHQDTDPSTYALDFGLSMRTPVLASRDGTVSNIHLGSGDCGGSDMAGEARIVFIKHADQVYSVYAHLDEVFVEKGQQVSQGQIIGLSGNSGWTDCDPNVGGSGAHLHYQHQRSDRKIRDSIKMCFAEVEEVAELVYEDTVQSQNHQLEVVSSMVLESGNQGNLKGEATFDNLGIGNTYYIVFNVEDKNSAGQNDMIGIIKSDGTGKKIWPNTNGWSPKWSSDGRMVIYNDFWALKSIPKDGSEANILLNHYCDEPAISRFNDWGACERDGSRSGGVNHDIYIFHHQNIWNEEPAGFAIVASDDVDDRNPEWAHNSNRLAYCVTGGGPNRPSGDDIGIYNMDMLGDPTHYLSEDFPELFELAIDCSWDLHWSSDDSKLLVMGGSRYIIILDLNSTNYSILAEGYSPNWSPDGSKVIFSNDGIWTINIDGSNLTRLGDGRLPIYSPDGSMIMLTDGYVDKESIYLMNSDGSNRVFLTSWSGNHVHYAWSPVPE